MFVTDHPMWRLSPALVVIAAILAVLHSLGCCLATQEEERPPVPWDSQPAWSPDGTRIAFVSTRNGPGGTPDGPENIWLINADGSNLRQLTTDGSNECPTWSADGMKIAFQAGAQIWQVEVATATITKLTKGTRGAFAPDWHPTDARKIACWFKTPQHDNDIFLIDPLTCRTEASGRRPLAIREGDDTSPRWSNDGARVAFVGEIKDPGGGDSTWRLMTMRGDGTDVRQHCEISEWTVSLSWFPDGNRVLVDGGKVCDLTTGQSTSLLDERLKHPDVSPDGQRLVYAVWVPSAGQFLFVRNVDGSGKTQITFP